MSNANERGPLPSEESLWDANDVARYLKVSRSWVYHQAENGTLPYRRVGALLRFEPASIREFVHGTTPNTRNPVAFQAPNKRPSS